MELHIVLMMARSLNCAKKEMACAVQVFDTVAAGTMAYSRVFTQNCTVCVLKA